MQFPQWYARKSFRTPLNIFPTEQGWAVFLPYGADKTEWLKNVNAGGAATMRHYGKSATVTDPRVVTKAVGAQHVLRRWRPIYNRSPFPEVLLLTQSG